jgi:hypothetical protein
MSLNLASLPLTGWAIKSDKSRLLLTQERGGATQLARTADRRNARHSSP